jgi:integrase
MRMGRTRTTRKDLPRRMYFEHGAYYFVAKDKKRTHLGREFGPAMAAYAAICQPPAGRHNLGAVMDAYLREKVPTKKPRTQDDYLDAITRLRPIFGAMWPEDLLPKHVYQYLRERTAKVRGNREIAVLSNVMQQAVEMGLIDANPCKQVRRNTESPRERAVTDADVTKLLPHCPAWLRAYISLKTLTGLRQGDMLRLGKANERPDGLYVETGKRGKRLLFNWTPALRAAWDACAGIRRRVSTLHLFASRNGTPMTASGFKTAWARAMAKAVKDGVESFAENDLRAKVAGEAMELGQDAASMLGHSTDAVTRRHYIRGTRKVSPLR